LVQFFYYLLVGDKILYNEGILINYDSNLKHYYDKKLTREQIDNIALERNHELICKNFDQEYKNVHSKNISMEIIQNKNLRNIVKRNTILIGMKEKKVRAIISRA